MLHSTFWHHFLRELALVVESNDLRWARLMGAFLRTTCHRVNQSPTSTLTVVEHRAIRKRDRTILMQGARELPAIPPWPKGRRGWIAKSNAHTLHARLKQHEESVPFIGDPDLSFMNNVACAAIGIARRSVTSGWPGSSRRCPAVSGSWQPAAAIHLLPLRLHRPDRRPHD